MENKREWWSKIIDARFMHLCDKRNVYYALVTAQDIICDLLAAMPEMEQMVLEKMELPDD